MEYITILKCMCSSREGKKNDYFSILERECDLIFTVLGCWYSMLSLCEHGLSKRLSKIIESRFDDDSLKMCGLQHDWLGNSRNLSPHIFKWWRLRNTDIEGSWKDINEWNMPILVEILDEYNITWSICNKSARLSLWKKIRFF